METRKRQNLYETGILSRQGISIISPESHTMGPENFKRYIGSYNRDSFDLDTKKFSKDQVNLIQEAYQKGYKIVVIGAYREDLTFLIKKNKAKRLGSVIEYTKPSLFNCRRQVMCKVESNDEGAIELWVLVFPSKHYVDQIAQLIKAIIADFASKNKPSSTDVEVVHFPGIENGIADWTGFSDFISLFIRHGDVVIIGNVDLILPGLAQYSFIPQKETFHEGGLDNMFGAKLLIHVHSSSRIVLIGVKESYWGDSSAQYVKAILESGAMHILYGSKAATMLKDTDVHCTYSPGYFKLLDENGNILDVDYYYRDISNLYGSLGITKTNFAITVPTVIGESHEQRNKLRPEGPTCMDCEDGHIAKVIAELNFQLGNGGVTSLTSDDFKKTFFPIHFITDYIYHSNEVINENTSALNVHAKDNHEYKLRRDNQFIKIGNAFAAYSLMLGRRNLKNKFENITIRISNNEDSYDDQFKRIRPLLDAGLGQQAIAVLFSESDGGLDIGVNKATVLAIICQKEGFIDSAFSLIEKLTNTEINEKLSESQKTQIYVIALKVYSQIGSISRVGKILNILNRPSNQELLKQIKQFGAVKRREAIWHALQNNQEESKNSIKHAIDDEASRIDSHYKFTNILFEVISKLPFSENYDNNELENISITLSQVRIEYLTTQHHENIWQTNFEKSAIAGLFLEAAFYLKTREEKYMRKGAAIMTIAHFLNVWFGGNEVSETYGEIIACSLDFKLKNILSLAMRQDSKSQFQFQHWINSKFNNLSIIVENFTKLLRLNINEREAAIQAYLKTLI